MKEEDVKYNLTMKKNATSVSLTGGAGFNFEDYIAAYFMVHLLSKSFPLGPEFGVVDSIDFQVSESGWLLDDLLITGKGSDEISRRLLSISIKRDRQVTSNGFPLYFVEDIWKQWLGTPPNPFVKEQDLLCLAVGKIADIVKDAWNEMLSQARSTSPQRMLERFSLHSKSNSKIQRNIFNSLHCPKNLKQVNNTDEVDTANLLKHIRLLHFDFQLPQSNDENKAIKLCQDCLFSGSTNEAIDLWGKLIPIAADLRPRGGTINRPQLIRKLLNFRFVDAPDFRSDWTLLHKVSEDAMDGIRTKIGSGIVIPQEALINEIISKLKDLHIQVLLGESGSGKSALAKNIAGLPMFDRIVWLTNEHLNSSGLYHSSRALGLTHDLVELLQSTGNQNALLIFDAAEKFSPISLQNTAKLIKSLKLNEGGSRWSVLLTVQPLNWGAIQNELQLYNGLKSINEIVKLVESPVRKELTTLYHNLPKIKPLMHRPGLEKLLSNLKILDWAAMALDKEPPTPSQWFGESHLIDWLWASWVKAEEGEGKYTRSGLLKKIGEREAHSYAGGIPLSSLEDSENKVLSELEGSQLLRVKEERVYFTHDLLGDWARLHLLMELNELQCAEKLKSQAENPRWHHAIRLFGLRILEQELDGTRWFRLHKQLNDGTTCGNEAADLVLDSVAISINASVLLERVWSYLSIDKGTLLNRLIKRFCHIASFPDPIVHSITNDVDSKIRFSAYLRIPYWPYWEPMLTFLYSHANEVIKIAFQSISELCRLWLSKIPVEISTGKPFPWRDKAAELALLSAREVQRLKAEGVLFCNGIDEAPYETFLYAAPELPEKVSALALELAQRRSPSHEILEKYKTPDTSLFSGLRLPPWPDGPTEKIDEAFRKVCIEKNALNFLMKYRPEVAKEVLLALCIKPPGYQFYRGDFFFQDSFATSSDNNSIIFLYKPFLFFLQTMPGTAIELIVKLVNFATERWLDFNRDIIEEYSVDLWIDDKRRKWTGNYQVFGWYRSNQIYANYVVSALMALEKWLYNETDAGRDIGVWVNKLFVEANSTAFAGVFTALAKKHPELLLNCLKPILSIWQIFLWDLDLIRNGGIPLYIYGVDIGEDAFNMARDWEQLPHRKIAIINQASALIPSNHEFRLYLKRIIKRWRKSFRHKKNQKLELTTELLNPDNYKISKDKAGNILLFESKYLKDYIKKIAESNSSTIDIQNFPIQYLQILDREQPLNTDGLEQHWKTLRYFADSLESLDQGIELYHTALMGGIAVLVTLHSSWLSMEPQKVQWCENQVQQITTKRHFKESSDSFLPNFRIDCKDFLGDIAIWYLAENISDRKTATEFLFRSIFTPNYEPIKRICKVAYQKKIKLGEDFGRILNLCRLCSGISWAVSQCQKLKIEIVRLQEWIKEVQQSFENSTLQVNPIPLYEIAKQSEYIIREAELKYKAEHKGNSYELISEEELLLPEQPEELPNLNRPGLNWQVLQDSYSWIPDIEEAANEDERRQWIALHRELIDLELTYIRNARLDSQGKIDGYPNNFERWVFTLIARLIPKLRVDERPEEFWQPLLELGAKGRYWIENFLFFWLLEGPKIVSSPKIFAIHWRSMIQYALSSSLWRNDYSVPFYYELKELQKELMGLGLFTSFGGRQEYSQMISELMPLYEQWAEEWLNEDSTANAFAIFLVKPAADQMVIPGLKWLAKGIKQIGQDEWDTCLSDSLMSVLCNCWEKYRPTLENDPDVKSAFSYILNILISKNDKNALELRDQIIQFSKCVVD